MKVESFLGVIDLSFGVVLMAVMYITIGTCSVLTNLYVWRKAPNKFSAIITIACLLCLIIIWIYAMYGAYNSDLYPNITLNALHYWTIYIIVWMVTLLMSTSTFFEEYVCLKGHCPESLWLYNNTWNDPILVEGFAISLTKFHDKLNLKNQEIFDLTDSSLTPNVDEPISLLYRNKGPSYRDVDWNTIIIIFTVVFFVVIFSYGWLVLYSFYLELKTLPECEADDNNDKYSVNSKLEDVC